jgi:3,4-dihydroxy-2-butanone 4-phosphate synthase
MTDSILSSVDDALTLYRKGGMVIVVDDEDRENEGDLVLAADFATPEAINFMVTHARGLVCLAMRGALLDRLQIPMMVPQAQNRSGFGTGFTLSVEAVHGVSTGISAEDRAQTILTLINPDTTPADIAMPGHMFPLRARDGGVLERRGQTEASVDLSMLTGLTPAGIICEVMREDGTMMRLEELSRFGKEHDLPIISVEQLAQYRRKLEGVEDGADAIADAGSDKAAAEAREEASREGGGERTGG